VKDCKVVLRIPEDVDKLESLKVSELFSLRYFQLRKGKWMDSAFTY